MLVKTCSCVTLFHTKSLWSKLLVSVSVYARAHTHRWPACASGVSAVSWTACVRVTGWQRQPPHQTVMKCVDVRRLPSTTCKPHPQAILKTPAVAKQNTSKYWYAIVCISCYIPMGYVASCSGQSILVSSSYTLINTHAPTHAPST